MIGMADVIVGLWFLPVMLNIIVPLIMLFGWIVGRLVLPKNRIRHVAEKQEGGAVQPDFFAKAGV